MKIDIFCHITPQNYFDRMMKLPEHGTTIKRRTANIPSMVNLDVRFRMMDKFGDYCQVVSMAAPRSKPWAIRIFLRSLRNSLTTAWPNLS